MATSLIVLVWPADGVEPVGHSGHSQIFKVPALWRCCQGRGPSCGFSFSRRSFIVDLDWTRPSYLTLGLSCR